MRRPNMSTMLLALVSIPGCGGDNFASSSSVGRTSDASDDSSSGGAPAVPVHEAGRGGDVGSGGHIGTGGFHPDLGDGSTEASPHDGGTGGDLGTGGTMDAGSTPPSGGHVGSGGSVGTGGVPNSGGTPGTGGKSSNGGTTGSVCALRGLRTVTNAEAAKAGALDLLTDMIEDFTRWASLPRCGPDPAMPKSQLLTQLESWKRHVETGLWVPKVPTE